MHSRKIVPVLQYIEKALFGEVGSGARLHTGRRREGSPA
jgi:hypothetical protein